MRFMKKGFFVVLPREHPLAQRGELRLKDIANEPLLLFDRSVSSGVYAFVDSTRRAFARQG